MPTNMQLLFMGIVVYNNWILITNNRRIMWYKNEMDLLFIMKLCVIVFKLQFLFVKGVNNGNLDVLL